MREGLGTVATPAAGAAGMSDLRAKVDREFDEYFWRLSISPGGGPCEESVRYFSKIILDLIPEGAVLVTEADAERLRPVVAEWFEVGYENGKLDSDVLAAAIIAKLREAE